MTAAVLKDAIKMTLLSFSGRTPEEPTVREWETNHTPPSKAEVRKVFKTQCTGKTLPLTLHIQEVSPIWEGNINLDLQ